MLAYPLYAVLVFYYQWLIKEASLACRKAEYSQDGRDIYREIIERLGRVRENPFNCLRRQIPELYQVSPTVMW